MEGINDIKNKLRELKHGKRKNGDEYRKLQNKLKKEKNKLNRKDKLNDNKVNIKENKTSDTSNVEYKIEENVELKLMFSDAYKYLGGLEHTAGDLSKKNKSKDYNEFVDEDLNNNVGESAENGDIEDSEDNEESSKKITETKSYCNGHESDEDQDEFKKGTDNSEMDRKSFIKNFKNKNNGIFGKITIKELKERTNNPELVEIWDTTASDPELLVFLKGYQGSVRVPQHWNSKRRYLQGKRGLERPPYKLPHYIEETNIAEIRALLLEEENRMTMKQKQRRKIRPKLNRMDIDYQVLHDAFFIYSTKPVLTQIGDLYYEGKEYEFRNKNIRPGKLSQRLKEALGMQPNWPPPWLIKMQKYGPPPSYPYLRVPGVNSQIPNGCQFGYKPGDWGKPPIDDDGKPIWGLLPPIEDEMSENKSKLSIIENSISDGIIPNGVASGGGSYNSLNYWGEVDNHNTNRVVADSDDEGDDNTKQLIKVGGEKVTTDLGSSYNNTGDNSINNVNLAGESNSNFKPFANSCVPKIVNPFLFNGDNLNSSKEKSEEANKPLYSVIERNEVNIDSNSIFPSSHGYKIK